MKHLIHRHLAAALALTLLLSASLVAHANDSSFGGSGADLVPLKETRVLMKSEEIILEYGFDKKVKDQAWTVRATYLFQNPTDEKITLQMGFPETTCHPDEDCNGKGGRFRQLQTRVRGKAVTHRTGKVGKKAPTWAPQVGQVYLFDVTFAPRETLTITHTYRYDRSTSVEGEWLDYLTRTGTLWGGPIGEARFIVRIPYRPWMFSYPPEYKLESYTTNASGKQTELIFAQRAWTPKRDFDIFFSDFHNLPAYTDTRCPDLLEARQAFWGRDGGEALEAHKKALSALSDADLRLCRNLSYAHHGYPFKSGDLRRHFYAKKVRKGWGVPWYPGKKEDFVHDPSFNRPWSFVVFYENPAFAPSHLTPLEGFFVKMIKEEEARRRKERSPE